MIDPGCVGAVSDPRRVEWTDRDTLLYALGVGAGSEELALVTENSHDVAQQVLPTYAVVVAAGFAVLPRIGPVSYGRMLHGAQEVRVHRPLPAAGALDVTAEIADLADKGEGRHAVVTLAGRGHDPDTGELVAQTTTTLVFRGSGGFGGGPGRPAPRVQIPDRDPDVTVVDDTDERLPLLYRLCGDRNPLHSDPWFARQKAGFPRTILHGLCSFGIAGRALVRGLACGDAHRLAAVAARFTAAVFPGDRLSTAIWRDDGDGGGAVFRVEARTGDADPRVVLDGGRAELVIA